MFIMRATVDTNPPRNRFFGQFLLSQGIVTTQQVVEAVEYQNRNNSRLGEIATALSMVTAADADRINALQLEKDLFFGEAAIQLGLLSRAQLEEVLAAQQDGHIRLGQALVSLGHLSESALQAALSSFAGQEAERSDTLSSLPVPCDTDPVARALVDLAPKMLRRSWNLSTKRDAALPGLSSVVLSDVNAVAKISGAGPCTAVLVGLPYAAAHRATKSAEAVNKASEGEAPRRRDMACDFLNLLANHVTIVCAEQESHVQIAPAVATGAQVTIEQGKTAVLIPFPSPLGRVLVALVH